MAVPVHISLAIAVLGGVVAMVTPVVVAAMAALVAMALFFIVVNVLVMPVVVMVMELSVLVMVLPLVNALNCSWPVVIMAMELLDVLLPFFVDRFNGFIVNTLSTPS
jgi:hypothetical protein